MLHYRKGAVSAYVDIRRRKSFALAWDFHSVFVAIAVSRKYFVLNKRKGLLFHALGVNSSGLTATWGRVLLFIIQW